MENSLPEPPVETESNADDVELGDDDYFDVVDDEDDNDRDEDDNVRDEDDDDRDVDDYDRDEASNDDSEDDGEDHSGDDSGDNSDDGDADEKSDNDNDEDNVGGDHKNDGDGREYVNTEKDYVDSGVNSLGATPPRDDHAVDDHHDVITNNDNRPEEPSDHMARLRAAMELAKQRIRDRKDPVKQAKTKLQQLDGHTKRCGYVYTCHKFTTFLTFLCNLIVTSLCIPLSTKKLIGWLISLYLWHSNLIASS